MGAPPGGVIENNPGGGGVIDNNPGGQFAGFSSFGIQQGSGLTFPWAIMTRDSHEAQWGSAGQRIVERILITWQDYVSVNAQSQLCGYATADGGGSLIRYPPWQHPQFPWLYVDADQGISSAKMIGRPFKTSGKTGPYVQYKYVILTLLFTERRYSVSAGPPNILPYPFVEFVDHGSAEYIQLDSGSYQYDPTDITVIAAGLANKPFKTGLAILDAKDTLTVIWRLVPHNYIHNSLGITSNILGALSTVNSMPFLGFAPGLIYFDSHDKERKSFPIDPQGVTQNSWAWDVTFYFKYRNPPTAPGAVIFGHNLAPAPQASPFGFWFPVTSVGAPGATLGGGSPLYQSSDLNNIFTQAY